MQEKLYAYFRNKGIYARVYRTYLTVAIVALLGLALVLSITYSLNTIHSFRVHNTDSLNYYSDNIANELYRFDNSIISISQDQRTQDILLNFFSMNQYQRYVTIEAITDLAIEHLHMIDYVTDVVLITNSYESFNIYGGPYGDFYIERLDVEDLLKNSFFSKTNTFLADISDFSDGDSVGNGRGA